MSPERGRQGDLFAGESAPPMSFSSPPEALPLLARQLLLWQERLAAFQDPLWREAPQRAPQQASLFPPAAAADPLRDCEPARLAQALQPLSLPAQHLSFWRWAHAPHEGAALYFVLDRPERLPQPLLLYVGETARADRRWKGAHDCKAYLAAYREALAKADLSARLSIRFWCEAPPATSARRALEQALIQRWKPPFNKETRGRWSTPFTAEEP
jgi:hypothetical protein